MESKLSLMNKCVGAEVRAEMAAQGLSAKRVADASGITVGQVNRIISKNPDIVRDINVTQVSEIAHALGTTPHKLVERAVERAGGIEAIWEDRERMRAAMSEAPVTNVTRLPTRDDAPVRKVADLFDEESDRSDFD